MNSPKTYATALFALLFLVVEASQAGLVRSSGRTSLSRDEGQLIYYAPTASLNSVGLTEEAFQNRGSLQSRVPLDVGAGVAAVPGGIGGCLKPLQEDVVFDTEDRINELLSDQSAFEPGSPDFNALEDEIAALEFSITNDPCTWEFQEGEALDLFGAFSMFFDLPEVTYEVNWNISGNGETFVLPGEINEEGPRTSSAGDMFLQGEGVFLNTPAPLGLGVGEYDLFVSVALSAPGEFFLTGGFDVVEFEEVCIDEGPVDDPVLVCGYNTFDSFGPITAPRAYFSAVESLRIIAADDNGPVSVSAPSTLFCSIAGLLALFRRRR